MRRSLLLASLAIIGGLLSACWSLATDSGGVFGPERGAPSDGGPLDPIPPDGATDAGSPRLCATLDASTTRRLCLDFETEPGDFDLVGGATSTVEDRDAGGGRAVRLAAPAGTTPQALLELATPAHPAEAWVELDFAVESLAGNGAATSLVAFIFRRGDDYYKIEIWLDGDGPSAGVAQGGSIGPESFVFSSTPFTLRAWHPLSFHVVFGGADARATLAIDGVTQIDLPIGPVAFENAPQTTFQLGMSVGPPSPSSSPSVLRLDNVVYDLITR